ncbi:MAG TPA: ABC transporter permease [Caulobacteraceae bacterium]|nr:ABC transporter permease [Caulobacteraceae bacterium]
MRRLILIAIREYLAYVKTPGFWISILVMPIGVLTLTQAPKLVDRTSPTPRLAIVDETGQGYGGAVAAAMSKPGEDGKPQAAIVALPQASSTDAADARAAITRALQDRLDAAAVLRLGHGSVTVDFWSRSIGNRGLEGAVGSALAAEMQRRAFLESGLQPGAVAHIEGLIPHLAEFSPRAGSGRIGLKDRLPGVLGLCMGILLWMVVLTGAGLLLSSVIEEKSSRILEVLLTSASVREIMAGKIAGVAAVSATVLGVWVSIAGAILWSRYPDIAGQILTLLLARGLIFYFALYFLGGYLMFATLYVTVGAACESVREAQTLLGPVMIIMSVPVVFMSQVLANPDAPLLRVLEWIPPFTPFLMAARAGAAPGIAEVAGTVALMTAVTALELWLAVPAFKAGALASGRFDWRRLAPALAKRPG